MKRKSFRANNPLQVLNRVSATQYEDTVHAGTPRDVQRGRCYRGSSNGYVVIGNTPDLNVKDFEIELYVFIPSDATGFGVICGNNLFNISGFMLSGWWLSIPVGTARPTISFWAANEDPANTGTATAFPDTLAKDEWVRLKLVIRSVGDGDGDGGEVEWFLNNESVGVTAILDVWGYADGLETELRLMGYNRSNFASPLPNGIEVFGFKISATAVPNSTRFYRCDEGSGAITYDSSGNGNHGTIMNAVTVPVEEDPNSIHQFQNIFSWQDITGYTLSDGVTYFQNSDGTGLIPAGVLIPRLESNV